MVLHQDWVGNELREVIDLDKALVIIKKDIGAGLVRKMKEEAVIAYEDGIITILPENIRVRRR